jgi:hypothetical protein
MSATEKEELKRIEGCHIIELFKAKRSPASARPVAVTAVSQQFPCGKARS